LTIITQFGHTGSRVVAKKGVAESDRPGLVEKVCELVVRTVGKVAFCGQGETLTLVCTVGVAGRGLGENGLAGQQEQHQTGVKGGNSVHDFIKS